MKSGSLPMIRTKASAESSKGSSQRTLWFVLPFFIAGYALGGLQKLFGGGVNSSLGMSKALYASGQHATRHQLHAGEPHHATLFQYDRLGLRRMAARLHVGSTHGSMHVTDASDTVYTRPEDYPLTQERVKGITTGGMLTITVANYAFYDFAINWVYHLKKAGMDSFMIAATDTRMLSALVTSPLVTGRHVWYMDTNISSGNLVGNPDGFWKMGRAKAQAMLSALNCGVDVLFNDIDMVWLRNPQPMFARFPEADVLSSTDLLTPTVHDESLEIMQPGGKLPDAMNIGLMLLRHRASVKHLLGNWTDLMTKDTQVFDQTAFNDLAGMPKHEGSQPPHNYWKGFNNETTFGILPAAFFSSGYLYFTQQIHKQMKIAPYSTHATYQFSGTAGKRNRLREALLWNDPPEHFDHPKGFVTIEMEITPALMEAARQPVHGRLTMGSLLDHFALVHHQLAQLRGALAVASLTGRALILPPFTCMLDRYWGPLWDGHFPTSSLKVPFICPADHVLDLANGWDVKLDPQTHGPHIEFKEHSFLLNARLSAAVRDSRADIVVCSGPRSAACPVLHQQDLSALQGSTLFTAPLLNSSALAQALEAVRSKKILTIKNAASIFSSFVNPQAQECWETRLRQYTDNNQCLAGVTGWVWYDMFFDKPHTDRYGRAFNGTWVPYLGNGKELVQPKDF